MLSATPRCRIEGSTLYFARVDEKGILLPSGRPWCTECSKLALDLGVKTWVLWHAEGPAEYDAAHYDWLSNRYDAWVPTAEADAAEEVAPEGSGLGARGSGEDSDGSEQEGGGA